MVAPRKENHTYDYLNSRIDYNPSTGVFRWKPKIENPSLGKDHIASVRSWNSQWAEKEAFLSVHKKGYLLANVEGKTYLAHRVAWILHYGKWPEVLIDHINGDKTDNTIENLREVDYLGNNRNMKKCYLNKSGITGVYWDSSRGKWKSSIQVEGKCINGGRTDDFFEACCTRKSLEVKYNFHINHGRR